MSVIFGVDFGAKKVGIAAVEMPHGIPYPVAIRPKAQGEAEGFIIETLAHHNSKLLVVGMPLNENGEETTTSQLAKVFCRRILKRTHCTIFLVDESDSSDEARERLENSQKRYPADQQIDAFAACIILERYLDPSKAYHLGTFQG